HIYVEAKMIPGVERVRLAFESERRFRQGLERLHGEKTEAVFHNWYHAWAQPRQLEWDMRPGLAPIACPLLVVQGEQDEHATPQHARDIAASVPGAQLWLEPGGRHMLPQEAPELFNRRVLRFMQGQAGGG
ncbi:MAG: alpha/beta hydrolase, partial [Anaerolineales bacterium]|nr:alpha/beta hydrolase [Anaerolineales bacterium]